MKTLGIHLLFLLFLMNFNSTFASDPMDWTEKVNLPAPQIDTLGNGLKVVWFENNKFPIISLGLTVLSGSRHNPGGKAGVVDLLTDILDRGSDGKTAIQIAEEVDSLGGSLSIGASDDTISVSTSGLSEDADQLLDILFRVALKPDFLDEEIKREKERTLDRWRHISDSTSSLASVASSRFIRSGTTYSRGSLWTVEEFQKITKEDLKNFHQIHFVPDNAVLMIVGQFNKKNIKDKIDQSLSNWKGVVPKKIFIAQKNKLYPSLYQSTEKGPIYVVPQKFAEQAQMKIAFNTPPFKSNDRYALAVANAIFGDFFDSRLNGVIRDQLGLTYSIGSGFDYYLELSYLSISSATRTETIGKLLKETLRILEELKSHPVTQEEVERAKDYLIGRFPIGLSSFSAIAGRWFTGFLYQMGPDYLNEFIPKFRTVNLDKVQKSIEKHLAPKALSIVISGEKSKVIRSLKNSGFNKINLIEPEDLY